MQEVAALVAAYWSRYRLLLGGRSERLRAEAGEGEWAWDAVESAAREGRADVLSLLDALLEVPEADPCYVGAGPLEELLCRHGARFDSAISARCRRSAAWQLAASCVWLDRQDAAPFTALRPYLTYVDFAPE